MLGDGDDILQAEEGAHAGISPDPAGALPGLPGRKLKPHPRQGQERAGDPAPKEPTRDHVNAFPQTAQVWQVPEPVKIANPPVLVWQSQMFASGPSWIIITSLFAVHQWAVEIEWVPAPDAASVSTPHCCGKPVGPHHFRQRASQPLGVLLVSTVKIGRASCRE